MQSITVESTAAEENAEVKSSPATQKKKITAQASAPDAHHDLQNQKKTVYFF